MQDVLLLINYVYSGLNTKKTALCDFVMAELGLAVVFLERSFHFFFFSFSDRKKHSARKGTAFMMT